jgi:hypothetical protein
MSQNLREFIRAREADIQKQIESLKVELRELTLARQAIEGGVSARDVDVQRAHTPKIKEMILAVLDSRPDGGTSDQIIDWVLRDFGVDVPRSSMSPQLSRLKSDFQVRLDPKTRAWQLPKHANAFKPIVAYTPREGFPETPETSDVMD